MDAVAALHRQPCRLVQHQQLCIHVQDAPLHVICQLRLQVPDMLWSDPCPRANAPQRLAAASGHASQYPHPVSSSVIQCAWKLLAKQISTVGMAYPLLRLGR